MFVFLHLQENHSRTRCRREEDVDTNAEHAVEERGVVKGNRRSRTRAAGAGAARSTGWGAGDSAGTGRASLLEKRRARAGGAAGRLGRGSTVEGAGVRVLLLGLVVGVESEGELLSGIAHAVSTKGTVGCVGVDAGARRTRVATDLTEEGSEVVILDVGGSNALKSLQHARAQVLVGRRRQRRGDSSPGASGGWAGSGAVGRAVRSRVDTSWVDGLHAAGKSSEVWQLAGSVAADGNETCK